MQSAIEIARAAVQLYAESRPRPSCVTQEQAAEMLGVSAPTLRKLIRSGAIRLNKLGKIPIGEVDRALEARSA